MAHPGNRGETDQIIILGIRRDPGESDEPCPAPVKCQNVLKTDNFVDGQTKIQDKIDKTPPDFHLYARPGKSRSQIKRNPVMPIYELQLFAKKLKTQYPSPVANLENLKLKKVPEEKAKDLVRQEILTGTWKDEASNLFFAKGEAAFGIELINQNNPKVFLAYKEKGIGDGLKEIEAPIYPWNSKEEDPNGDGTALRYFLEGSVEGKFAAENIPVATGATVGFGLDANSSITASYIRSHDENEFLKDAISDDLTTNPKFRFALDSSHLGKLGKGEYLMTEMQGGFSFKGNISWGEVFSSKPGLLASLLPNQAAIKPSLQGDKIGGNASAKASLKVTYATRLELIAFSPDSNSPSTRILIRKASTRGTSVSVSAKVRASLIDKKSAEELIGTFLGKVVDEDGKLQFQLKNKALPFLLGHLEKWKKDFNFESLLEGLDDKSSEVINSITEKLKIPIPDLLVLKEKSTRLQEAFNSYSSDLSWSNSKITALRKKISVQLDKVTLDDLPEEFSSLASKAQSLPLLKGLGLAELSELLSIPDLLSEAEKELKEKHENLFKELSGKFNLTPLEALRAEIQRRIGDLPLKELFSEKQFDLLKFTSEAAGLEIQQVLSNFSLLNLLEKTAPTGKLVEVIDAIKKITGKLDQLDLNDLEILKASQRKLAEALQKHFGISLAAIGPKINELADHLATAISSEMEASAGFEFDVIKEDEALLEFDYVHANGSLSKLRKHYDQLLTGNWDKVLEAMRTNPKNSNGKKAFHNLTFFALETVTKRASSRLRFLWASFGRKSQSQRQTVTNLQGNVSHSCSELAMFDGEISWKDGKQEWMGGSGLSAKSPKFYPPKSVEWRAFELEFTSSFSCKGTFGNKFDDAMLRLLAKYLDLTGKTKGVTSKLKEFSQNTPADQPVTLAYSLIVTDPVFRSFLEMVKSKKFWNRYKKIWIDEKSGFGKVMKETPGTVAKSSYKDMNNKRYNKDLEAMRRILTGEEKPKNFKDFSGDLADWRHEHNRTGGSFRKLDKYYRPLAIMNILDPRQSGWTLSASLSDGKQQFFF